ncbi:MAG: hypothetical protein ACLS48_10050 [[Eubacterium] siraeum]
MIIKEKDAVMIEQIALFENGPEDLDCKTTLENIIVAVSAKWNVQTGFSAYRKQKQRQTYRVFDYFENAFL